MACATSSTPWGAATRRLAAWLSALFVLLVAAGDAHATDDEQRVAIAPIELDGASPDYLVQDLAARLLAGIGAAAHAVEDPATCGDRDCWIAFAARTQATHVVRTTLAVRDRDYDVRADLIDGRTGEVIATVTRACDICGAQELATTVEDVADALRRKLASERPRPPILIVTTAPTGAQVTVDDAPVGSTPLEVEVAVGTHDVQVGKRGHITQRRRIAFVDGVRETWEVELAVALTEQRGPVGRPLRVAGWSAIGVGLAAVGVGVGFAVLDEEPIRSRCSGANVDIEGNCKYRYDTLAGGVVSAAIGGALVVTGIALVVVDRRRNRDRRVALAPTWRGVALWGRF